jgi:hypothetical protein
VQARRYCTLHSLLIEGYASSEEIVDSLLGDAKGDATTGSTKQKAKDILNNLLKQQ